MEASSIGILFGCAGAAAAFLGTRFYIRKHQSWQAVAGKGLDAQIRKAYDQLFLLRLGCLILSLAAAGIWFIEPKPYIPGALVAVACLMLWKAYRLRGALMKRVREASHGMMPGMVMPSASREKRQ